MFTTAMQRFLVLRLSTIVTYTWNQIIAKVYGLEQLCIITGASTEVTVSLGRRLHCRKDT
jgi:hypothetical protein